MPPSFLENYNSSYLQYTGTAKGMASYVERNVGIDNIKIEVVKKKFRETWLYSITIKLLENV